MSLSQIEIDLDRAESNLKRTAHRLATVELLYMHDPGSTALRVCLNKSRARYEFWKQRQRACALEFIHEPLRGTCR